MMLDATVRPVRADEWARVRALRVEAVHDPAAAIAFVDSAERTASLSARDQDGSAGSPPESTSLSCCGSCVASPVDDPSGRSSVYCCSSSVGLLDPPGVVSLLARTVPPRREAPAQDRP
ncbi:hypothetical protein BIU90_02515 [Curtobacterium sp. MCBA15_001]|nr:hypothetical protein BIU90_02515 [Curtobacterium sp. MCBA15_001]